MTFPRVAIGQIVNVAGRDYVFDQSSTEGFNALAELAEIAETIGADALQKILALPVNMRRANEPRIFDNILLDILVKALGVPRAG